MEYQDNSVENNEKPVYSIKRRLFATTLVIIAVLLLALVFWLYFMLPGVNTQNNQMPNDTSTDTDTDQGLVYPDVEEVTVILNQMREAPVETVDLDERRALLLNMQDNIANNSEISEEEQRGILLQMQ